MAQIKKGFIAANAIDGSKLKLLNNEAIRAAQADGADVELMKLDDSNVLQFLKMPQVSADPSQGNDVARKSYVDAQVSAAGDSAAAGLASEQSARESADSGLQSAIDTEKGRIDAILSAATADADSFAEIVNLINSVDTESDSAFGSYVLSNNAALAQESADRAAGDAGLASDVADEASARQSADTALQGNLDQEVADRQAADSAEQSAREGADATLQGNIDAEASTRGNADSALSGRLDVLEADPVTKSYVDTWGGDEANTRSAADANLQSQIDNLTSNMDPAALDSLTEIVTAFQAADSDMTAAVTALGTSASSAVAAEESRATAAEGVLQAAIDAEVSRAQGQEAAIDTRFTNNEAASAAEVSNRQAAVSAEQSAREAEDATLQGNIDSEESAREAADSALDVRVDALEAVTSRKEKIVLSAGDASNGYVDLAVTCKTDSEMVFIGSLYAHDGDDYTVSTVGGKTRITFAGPLAAGGASEMAENEIVYVRYLSSETANGGGGGGGEPTLLIDSPNVAQGGGIWRSSDLPWGQYARSFGITMPASGTLSKISLEAKTYQGMVGNGTLSLAIKDAVDGSVLATSNGVDVATLNPAMYTFVDFVFASPSVSLMANQTYAIEAVFSGTQAAVEIARNGSSPYFPGHSYREINTGETQVGYDGIATNAKVYTV